VEDCLVSFEPASASFATPTLSGRRARRSHQRPREILTGRLPRNRARHRAACACACCPPAPRAAGVPSPTSATRTSPPRGFDPEGNILATACKADAAPPSCGSPPRADRNHDDGVPDDW
jgi:hypothetical protein